MTSSVSTADNLQPDQAEQEKEAPLSLSLKLAYGAPSFAGAAMAIPIGIHLTIFYSDTILVPLGLIALVKALARALDAVTDPLVGWLSDRTKTRWGRRRPWIALGAPLCAIAFYFMFTPPEQLNGIDAAAWFAVTYTLYYLFHTMYIIPHYGLGPELTLDYHERTTLFGIREVFTVLGTLVAAILPPVLISTLGGEREAYTGFSVIFGCLLALLYFNLVWRVKERPDFMARPSNPLIPGVRRVMRNRVFRLLLVVYLIGSITGAIPGLMMPYFNKYILQPENSNLWLAIYLATYFGAGLICLPIWIWAAKRFEKKPVWLVSFAPGVIGGVSLFLWGEGDMIPALISLTIAGAGFGAGLFLGPSMQADVIDYDELCTGKRREAQYSALWSIMTKFMVIPSMSIPLAVLASVGYAPNIVQSDEVQLTIRVIFCLAPATAACIAFFAACFYPITKAVHGEIWEGINAHKRGETVTDPITGHLLLPPASRGVEEDTGWFLDHFSMGELNRSQGGNTGKVQMEISLYCIGSMSSFAFFAWLLFDEIDLEVAPGLMAVLYVVGIGVSLTASVYHIIRLRVANKLQGYTDADVALHVKVSHQMKYGL